MVKRKTTAKEFELFKKSFLKWRDKLGLTDWRLNFKVDNIGSNYGTIYTKFTGKAATVVMTNEVNNKDEMSIFDAKKCGRHECLHLLLASLCYHAHARYIHQEDIDVAEETVIRRLEKVLGD